MEPREKISSGPNEAPVNEAIAGTAPGIPDEAATPGREAIPLPSDEEIERIARKLGAPIHRRADADPES